MKHVRILTCLAALSSAHACAPPPCEEGTHEEAGRCVASLSPQCGPGTELRAGVCAPSEGGAVCGDGTHAEQGTCVPDVSLTGNSGRLDSAQLLAPPVLAQVASDSLSDAFAGGDELLFVGLYDPTGQRPRLYGGGGLRGGDVTFALIQERGFDIAATRDEEGLLTSEPSALMFPVFGGGFIRLERTVVSATEIMDIDGVLIATAGRFTGIITPDNAQEVFIDIAGGTLAEVLVGIGEVPDADFDGDGTAESWTFDLVFTAEPVWLL